MLASLPTTTRPSSRSRPPNRSRPNRRPQPLRLPPLRLVSRGVFNADLEKVILANVRTPDERKGDLGAQLAATLRATERLVSLAHRHGSARLIAFMAQVMDYSDRLMRAALEDLPDGEEAFEDFCRNPLAFEAGAGAIRKIRQFLAKRARV